MSKRIGIDQIFYETKKYVGTDVISIALLYEFLTKKEISENE